MDDQNMQGMPQDDASDETKTDGTEKPEEGAEGAEEPKEEGQM
jgi:hypothetical protein